MQKRLEKLIEALLYEGYLLYPYRKSALKNAQRFNFGLLAPGESFQTEVLVQGEFEAVTVEARFLQTQTRQVIDGQGAFHERLELDGQVFETWDEAVERKIETERTLDFEFASAESEEILIDGQAKFVRRTAQIKGRLSIKETFLRSDLRRLTVIIENLSEKDKFISTNIVLSVEKGRFISLLEFEKEFETDVKSLTQKGLFPVLAKDTTMLSAPIILYDFPQIAEESAVDLMDATEIDELLILRILTMTEDEKREARSLDERARRLFEQAEKTDLENLHGTFRDAAKSLEIGQKVRLKPQKSADAFDIFLENKIAVIESVDEDFEGRKHFAVTLETDEGRTFGFDKFIGHRFFFSSDELEALPETD